MGRRSPGTQIEVFIINWAGAIALVVSPAHKKNYLRHRDIEVQRIVPSNNFLHFGSNVVQVTDLRLAGKKMWKFLDELA